jgi:hypothetical protein
VALLGFAMGHKLVMAAHEDQGDKFFVMRKTRDHRIGVVGDR